MAKLSDVLMIDGGWGFSISRDGSHRPPLWITYATEEDAKVSREAIAKALESATQVIEP